MVKITIDSNHEDVARFFCEGVCVAEVTRIMISPSVGEYIEVRGNTYKVFELTHDLSTGDVSYEVEEV